MERAIKGDVGIVKANKADTYGNLYFEGTSRNFNPECAMAAKFTIAEVEEIVEPGNIKPEDVHLPGIYVHAIVQTNVEKKIERVTTTDPNKTSSTVFSESSSPA